MFGESFVRIGLHADWSGTYFLPRLVGTAKALELCWLGDMIDAAEALRIGLVNRVVPHDRLEEETRALARRLADAPQMSIRNAKRAHYASSHRTLEECLAAETAAQAECWRARTRRKECVPSRRSEPRGLARQQTRGTAHPRSLPACSSESALPGAHLYRPHDLERFQLARTPGERTAPDLVRAFADDLDVGEFCSRIMCR
jgi:hypothetical protein